MGKSKRRAYQPLQIDIRVFDSNGGGTTTVCGVIFIDGTVELNGILSTGGLDDHITGVVDSYDTRQLEKLVAHLINVGRTGMVKPH
jgi:hypothetical protein